MHDLKFEEALGLEYIQSVIGNTLVRITRYVLSFGLANDQDEHGITELQFDKQTIFVSPGRNEDFIDIHKDLTRISNLSSNHWTKIELTGAVGYIECVNQKLYSVEVFADSAGDKAIVFSFSNSSSLWIYYDETDLNIAFDKPTNILVNLALRRVLSGANTGDTRSC